MQHLLAKVEDVSDATVTKVDFFGRPAIVYREGDRFAAAIDVCTHLGGPLQLDGGQLRCQWHGACFARDSGKPVSGPASARLIRLPTKVRDGGIYYVVGE